MKVTLTRKIRFSLLLLFGLLLLVISVGYFALFQITGDTKNIFRANYESLEYVEQMRRALFVSDWEHFSAALDKQMRNITEPGEREVSEHLKTDFARYRLVQSDSLRGRIHDNLAHIHQINREAVIRSNELIYRKSEKYALWMAVIGTCSFLLAFTLIFNLPEYIARPVHRLREGMKGISARQYTTRIHGHSHDEFGELTRAFNDMAARLEQWEKSNLAMLLKANRRLELTIAQFPDAVICIDETDRLLYINPAGAEMLALDPAAAIGKPALETARHNDLLRELLALRHETAVFRVFWRGNDLEFTAACSEITDNEAQQYGRLVLLRPKTSL